MAFPVPWLLWSRQLLCFTLLQSGSTHKSLGCALPAPGHIPVESVGRECGAGASAQSWRDTLFLLGWAARAGRTFQAQPLRRLDSLTLPKESCQEGSDYLLIVQITNMAERYPQPGFLCRPSPASAGFASFQ